MFSESRGELPGRPLRALLISDVYFPRVNGVSTSIRTFRADLVAAGVDTALIVPDYGAGNDAAQPSRSAPSSSLKTNTSGDEEAGIFRVAAGRVPGDPEDRRMKLGALRAVLAQLQSQPFDIVHVQTPFVAHYAGVRFGRRRGLPVVASYHTLFEEYLHHYVPVLPRALGRVLARSFTRAQSAPLAALVAPSEPMRELLLTYGVKTRIEVIPTGLSADRYVLGEGARFRQRFGIPVDQPLLLYVGRVAHEKNIEFLLHAYVALRRRRPDALFAIAGEGPAREHLRALANRLGIAAQVQFIGYLEREHALADCYAAADVFVFASRTETQGLVLLEALAQARPVVSTAHLGTASVLKDGCGARVVPENAELFAQAVADILRDPTYAAQLSGQARVYAQGWAASHMARRLAELYRELGAARVTDMQAA